MSPGRRALRDGEPAEVAVVRDDHALLVRGPPQDGLVRRPVEVGGGGRENVEAELPELSADLTVDVFVGEEREVAQPHAVTFTSQTESPWSDLAAKRSASASASGATCGYVSRTCC